MERQATFFCTWEACSNLPPAGTRLMGTPLTCPLGPSL